MAQLTTAVLVLASALRSPIISAMSSRAQLLLGNLDDD